MPERIGLSKTSKKLERLLELIFGGEVPYHIHPETGNVSTCRAKTKCPFGDIESQHYASFEEGRAIFEKQEEFFQNARNIKITPNELTDRALRANLHKTYDKPQWLNDLIESRPHEKIMGEEPRIIDQFELNGQVIDVLFSRNSLSKADQAIQNKNGYDLSSIEYRDDETGDIIGYLKATYKTPESIKRCFGNDNWSHVKQIESSEVGRDLMRHERDENGKLVAAPHFDHTMTAREQRAGKELFLKNSIQYLDKKFLGNEKKKIYGISSKSLTDEQLDEKVEMVQGLLKKVVDQKDQYYMNKPYIDFSRINDDYRGQGLGESLYVYASRVLGEQGMTLRSSGLQSDDAKKVWLRMAANKQLPIKMTNTVHYNGERKIIETAPMLDFRNLKN